VNTTLATAVKEVITKANQLKSHMTAPPVRYEPYSLWFWGDPGTGKTTLMQKMTIDLAENINVVRNGDPIYVRSPHSVWWNGYDGEPITMLDDANGVNDPTILGRMISEFQAMKTSAKMRIEMPRLEEKNAEMTSIIMAVCSNLSEWTSTMIVDKEAFRRRRDMLAKVCWSPKAEEWFKSNPSIQKVASKLPASILQNNDHIVFLVSNNPARNDLTGTTYNYDAFRQLVLDHHKDYHNVEIEKMMVRYEKSLQLSKQASENVMDRQTLKTALMAVLMGCESSEVMAETMKRQLFEMKTVSPERYAQLPIHTRNIVNRMKETQIIHEIPAIADPLSMVNACEDMSEWFKTVLFPAYDVGSSLNNAFMQEFRPWIYEQQRSFEMDLITSPCSICRENQTLSRSVSYICPKSVCDNQHWICTRCKPGYDSGFSSTCPVCRGENIVAISKNQRLWRFHNRVAHITKTLARRISIPIVASFKVIWKNAIVVSYISMMTVLTYVVISRDLRELADEAMYRSEIKTFIQQYGMMPEQYDILNNECIFSIGKSVFGKNSEGIYERINGIDYESPKNKGQGKKTTNENQDKIKESKIKQLVEQAGNRILTMEEVIEASTSKDAIRRNSTPSETSDDSFRSPHPEEIDYLLNFPTVKCVLEHGNSDLLQIIRKQKRPLIYFENNNFIINIRVDNEEAKTLLLPFSKCETPGCKMNVVMTEISKLYFDQRHENWKTRMQNNEDVFESEEEEIPSAFKAIFHEIYPQIIVQPEIQWYVSMIEHQKCMLHHLRGQILYWIQVIYEQICEKWFYITSFIALFFAMYYGIKYYYSEEEGVTLEPMHESSQPRETGKGRKDLAPNTRLYVKNPQPSHEIKMSMNTKLPDNIKSISDLIFKNRFTVKCAGYEIHGFVLMNNIGMFPRHAYALLSYLQQEKEPIIIVNPDNSQFIVEQNFGMHVIEDCVRGEYVLLQHKRLTGKDIRHHIYTTVRDSVSYPPYAYGVDLQTSTVIPIRILSVDQKTDEEAQSITTEWKVKDKTYKYTSKMVEYLTAEGFRGQGKCGSPLLNPEGKIISIHFAGHEIAGVHYGYSAPIFKEQFDVAAVQAQEPLNIKHEMNSFPNLKYYSHYPNPPYHTESTKLRPSEIASKAWDSTTFPCIQSDKDLRYKFADTPLRDGVSTIGAVTNSPEIFSLRSATRAVAEEMLKHMTTPSMPAPVSVFEAVTAANHNFVESMNLSTSAGLPWIADFTRKNLKSDYIQHQITKDGKHTVKLTDNFKEKYEMQFNMRLHGMPPREPFWAHLKDERRKEEKLTSFGGTRVFSVSPLELVLSCRRALLPIMDAFHSNPVKLHHAIGLSPDSTQWTELIESLRMKSDKIIQLDFSKFSDSMPWEFVEAAFDVVISYYEHYNLMNPELYHLLQTIKYEITRSLICVGDEVYELLNGVLQGHPITSLINSLVNIIEQVYVWIRLTGSTGTDFFKQCGIVVMGDDVVISVPKRFLRTYNGQTIAKEFALMNIVVTDETKSKDNIQKYQDINRFDFLSCSYMLHPYRNLYLAPSDPSSIYDTALWIRRKDGPFYDATQENVEQSLMNCFGHGPCIYEMYRATLEFLTGLQFRSWFDLDYIFYKEAGLGRSVVETNLGVVTGTSPKSRDLLGARIGRIDEADNIIHENQYWNVDFLANVKLDTRGIEAGKYRCKCRYDCENELMKRIQQVEIKTRTSRTQFLPFTSQEEGTRILGARINVERTAKSRGYSSTIAIADYVSVTCDSAVGLTDGTRDRVYKMDQQIEDDIQCYVMG